MWKNLQIQDKFLKIKTNKKKYISSIIGREKKSGFAETDKQVDGQASRQTRK